ncbi:ATP-binding protein [Pseudomonas sp. LMG 31766]|uniref:AAA family ATPase n=1 Tax=Pseudomonas chaetocerotis TaxID=2758695 RepID=A0A931D0X8_9PSED|nr:AAA family ATPase [Pseudomonas chaetocerotis]MBZ9666956.1 ATP-binding protein [Pseudomonas chaetocerotis]
MKISSIRIKNFRTITTEQVLNISDGITLVGPNNSGKTNALLALYYFFTGYENKYNYEPERDLPFDSGNSQTSLTCFFEVDQLVDAELIERLKKLRQMLKIPKVETSDNFSINVYFNRTLPVYQVYPGAKKADGKSPQYSTLQKTIVTSVLEFFRCYYIPSNKSIAQLYDEFVSPFVKKKLAEALSDYDDLIRGSISSLTDSMNQELLVCGLSKKDAVVSATLEYPRNSLEHLISGFELMVSDRSKSSIFTKGMGLQSAVLLSSFKWITEQSPDKSIIWLIEEPETYMHPSLAYQSSKILDQLASVSTVIKTTHSLSFMPQSVRNVQGVTSSEKGIGTRLSSYTTMQEATENIRLSLGVKFSDYFGLTDVNVFVEGKTDITYLGQLAAHCEYAYDTPMLLASSSVQYRDFGGVTGLVGFLRANYELIRKEVAVVSLFDGDDAGLKGVRELNGYLGGKNCFQGNIDYVVIPNRVAIEGLFPDEWILEAHADHPSWFELFIPDAAEGIGEFKVDGTHKTQFMNYMLRRVDAVEDYGFLEKFKPVLLATENALRAGVKRLWPNSTLHHAWSDKVDF